jgi:hypothetical protein
VTDKILAPWSAEQVAALNRFQADGGMHPFTCGNEHPAHLSPVLWATTAGWRCNIIGCNYEQDWAHAFMADPDAWPKPWQRFTAHPVTPEMERAATERATQAAEDSERATEQLAGQSGLRIPDPRQDVAGRCPACHGTSLFLGSGGHVTCSRIDCPDPSLADTLLHDEHTSDLTAAAGRLRDLAAILAEQAPAPLPTAEELAAGQTADKVTAQRIQAARKGIPLHHIFNTLQALRAVRAIHRVPGVDREPRIPLADLDAESLEQLYDDLDRYEEVQGEMNERAINQERALAALREVSRGYCPACGRGDAAPTVEHWERQKALADQAEELLRVAHGAGPDVAECRDADRRWSLESEGE